MSDSYPEMKRWLISNYGGVSRIISDTVNDLNRRAKPNPNNTTQKFTFYTGISGALQRMERFSKVGEIDKQELENCVYSRATLSSLSLVLPTEAYADWITENCVYSRATLSSLSLVLPTEAYADWITRTPLGRLHTKFSRTIIERNKNEGSEKLSVPVEPDLLQG